MNKKPKILFYDIETTPILTWNWRLGDQTVRHGQLVDFTDLVKYVLSKTNIDRRSKKELATIADSEFDKRFNYTDIICITYCWNDGKKAKSLDWGYKEQDSSHMITEFDKLVKKADVTIGKNSDRFDVKHINTLRMLHNIYPLPDWAMYTDDLEKQMRKHFNLPSNSLDYFSNLMDIGGKVKMEFQDWIDICLQLKKKSFDKMIRYGKKDVEDTRHLWNRVSGYITPKYNVAKHYGGLRCTYCGSDKIHKNGTRRKGQTTYQRFECNDHGGYAGRCVIKKDGSLSDKMS